MLKKLFEYINDNKLKITITNDYLDIENYQEIINISEKEIKIDCKTYIIIIEGELIINKLLSNELLITGKIKKIYFE